MHHALSCISISRATPLGRLRYQISSFPPRRSSSPSYLPIAKLPAPPVLTVFLVLPLPTPTPGTLQGYLTYKKTHPPRTLP